MKITATFLDEISHDIPHQNWGRKEWDRDFQAMKRIGIDTVVLIRCGWKHWMTYPSEILVREENGFLPPVDLVALFLELAEKHGLSFYFGLYDSGKYWHSETPEKEAELNIRIADEVWQRYGSSPAMKGWYLSQEISRNTGKIIDIYHRMGKHCKDISGGLPVMISPWIEGSKAVSAFSSSLDRSQSISVAEHEREWEEIMSGIAGAVDIVAFQDGHVDFHELQDFLAVNLELARRHGLDCWTNTETFDRDMPIKFLPIKWEKLLLKLTAAERVGIEKAITFEFSHFMSPHSSYPQAHGLYQRYEEWITAN